MNRNGEHKLKVFPLVLIFFIGCAAPPDKIEPVESRLVQAAVVNEAAALIGAGKFASAEQKYRLALRQSPGDVSLRLGLATAIAKQFASLGRPSAGRAQASEAIDIYQTLLKERPNSLGVVLGAAAGYESLGDRDQALELFQRGFLLADSPDIAAVALRNYATVAYEKGAFSDAVRASRSAYDTRPSAEEACRHLAILNPLGMVKEATDFSALALTLYGGDGELLTRAAASYAAAGDCVQAEQLAIRSIEQGKIAEPLRQDARLVIDWCHGNNRLSELRPEEIDVWPLALRPSKRSSQ